ncbi:MAG TPA: hypothetical protein VLJ62_22585 [Burkholderiaceae bacterium]|nr:hypothetical protein [Burkholderiaceae bacterium]
MVSWASRGVAMRRGAIMAELVDDTGRRRRRQTRAAASAPRKNSQMRLEQSTASVEKLVGKPVPVAARARVLVLRVGLPEF